MVCLSRALLTQALAVVLAQLCYAPRAVAATAASGWPVDEALVRLLRKATGDGTLSGGPWHPCTLETLDGGGLTPDAFAPYRSRAVRVQGAMKTWGAMKKWATQEAFLASEEDCGHHGCLRLKKEDPMVRDVPRHVDYHGQTG